MADDEAVRQVVETELKRFQGLLLFADIQALKRGDFRAVARKVVRRVNGCWIGLYLLLGYVAYIRIAISRARAPENLLDILGETFGIAIGVLVLLYLANRWGKFRGSMDTLLALIYEEKKETPTEDPDGASD